MFLQLNNSSKSSGDLKLVTVSIIGLIYIRKIKEIIRLAGQSAKLIILDKKIDFRFLKMNEKVNFAR